MGYSPLYGGALPGFGCSGGCSSFVRLFRLRSYGKPRSFDRSALSCSQSLWSLFLGCGTCKVSNLTAAVGSEGGCTDRRKLVQGLREVQVKLSRPLLHRNQVANQQGVKLDQVLYTLGVPDVRCLTQVDPRPLDNVLEAQANVLSPGQLRNRHMGQSVPGSP